ncbi:MAG: amidohydrolase family protein, partial [Terrimesophilobacter sp.]
MSTLIDNIGLLVTNQEERREQSHAAIVMDGGVVTWAGDAGTAPSADERIDAEGRCVVPGFVDSHSHLIFAGDRSDEFEARMIGQKYAAGGIRRTVGLTRTASDTELSENARNLIAEMRSQGTTTVEIKSGYGLTTHDEARALEIAGQFTTETTYL